MGRPTATQLGDAIVEQTEGDEDMAQTVADGMVADKEEALKKLEKAKIERWQLHCRKDCFRERTQSGD